MILLDGWGARIREERQRKALNQGDFGTLGDVKRMTQNAYESESNYPTLGYFLRLQEADVDVIYVLTGSRSYKALDETESSLIGMFRGLTADKQEVVTATIRVMLPVASGNGTKSEVSAKN